MSLIAVFAGANLGYVRMSFAFSVSNSRNRFSSETPAPPYFDFQP